MADSALGHFRRFGRRRSVGFVSESPGAMSSRTTKAGEGISRNMAKSRIPTELSRLLDCQTSLFCALLNSCLRLVYDLASHLLDLFQRILCNLLGAVDQVIACISQ